MIPSLLSRLLFRPFSVLCSASCLVPRVAVLSSCFVIVIRAPSCVLYCLTFNLALALIVLSPSSAAVLSCIFVIIPVFILQLFHSSASLSYSFLCCPFFALICTVVHLVMLLLACLFAFLLSRAVRIGSVCSAHKICHEVPRNLVARSGLHLLHSVSSEGSEFEQEYMQHFLVLNASCI